MFRWLSPERLGGGMSQRQAPQVGIRPTVRFAVALAFTATYVAFAVHVSAPWRGELREAVGPVMAWVIPTMMAYIPSVVIGFMIFTLLTLRYRVPPAEPPIGSWPKGTWPPVTVVIAARNEEDAIVPTLNRISRLSYPGQIEVVLADNNSTDRTAELAEGAARQSGLNFRRSFEAEAGKYRALNTALQSVKTPITVTVDADTLLHPQALGYLIARLGSRPQDQHVCACAGALVVENASDNLLCKMQAWDYRLGINGVKRMQGAYNCTLVAQGAFSAYWTEDLRAVGGWPDAIGEDIVLTWTMMASRGLVQYEPCALGYTAAPEKLRPFMRQRSRWAEGMFEGLHKNPPTEQPRVLARFVAGIDYLVPFLDFGYVFFWIPGVILFIAGYPLLFSWWSMLVLPITLVIFGLMRRWQERHVFRRLGVRLKQDIRGFYSYLFGYQAITSSASLLGYMDYLTEAPRRWK